MTRYSYVSFGIITFWKIEMTLPLEVVTPEIVNVSIP